MLFARRHGPRRGSLTSRLSFAATLLMLASMLAACGARTGASAAQAPASAASDPVKVGVLHSLSGTMSISETSVKDSTLMAIDEINAKGGVLGKKITPVVEDGASDWPTFAEKTKKLLQ